MEKLKRWSFLWSASALACVEAVAVLWCFLQGLLVFFSVFFGVMYDALFDGTTPISTPAVILAVLLLAFLTPLLVPRRAERARWAFAASAGLAFLLRVPLSANQPTVRLIFSLGLIAGGAFYLGALARHRAHLLTSSMIFALLVQQVFYSLGHTYDITLRSGWVPLQAVLSALVLAGSLRALWREKPVESISARLGWLGGLGFGGFLFLQTALLNFPVAAARWAGSPRWQGFFVLVVVLWPVLNIGTVSRTWLSQVLEKGSTRTVASGLVLGGLVLSWVLRTTDGFGNGGAILGLAMLQLGVLTALAGFLLPAREGPRAGKDAGLVLGLVLFLMLHFVYAFAFTYPYTIELFRGAGPLILALAAVLTGLGACRRGGAPSPRLDRRWALRLGVLVVLPIAVVWSWDFLVVGGGRETEPGLRVATYNIHYGYDEGWRYSLQQMAETVEEEMPGFVRLVIFLQEVDAGRPTSLMVDDAVWLAARLHMRQVYVPCVEQLTGVAVLTHLSVVEQRLYLLPSELEQTGMAALDFYIEDNLHLHAFGTWLGLEPEERAAQIDAALEVMIATEGPAVFGGDLNADGDAFVYQRLLEAGFRDPWVELGLEPPLTDPAREPHLRSDYIWLRDLEPLDAWVSASLASDHRMVIVEVRRP